MSNWEASSLSSSQVTYAALDAFLSLLVHEELEARGAYADDSRQKVVKIAENLLKSESFAANRGGFRRCLNLLRESDEETSAFRRVIADLDRQRYIEARSSRTLHCFLAMLLGRLGWTYSVGIEGHEHFILCQGRVLGRASARTRSGAVAIIADSVTKELLRVQDKIHPSCDLLEAYAFAGRGQVQVPIEFIEYLNSKAIAPSQSIRGPNWTEISVHSAVQSSRDPYSLL